uniref:ATP synthase subunit delta, chloroplastic n=1 Tax=Osmundea sinicola TaxID=290685 RepID=A0A7L4WP77_9FLOR|nr:ATP synthase CF1 subunit delta [Osmundea sinicola]QFR99877.1 ATP synthase CF1 subunit delta [Osmundea sinicola]
MSNKTLMSTVALPYAEALLDVAKQENLLDEFTHNLSSISMVLSETKELRELLSNPVVDSVLKKEILQRLFVHQVNDSILNFLFILVDRRRINFLDIIIEKYLELNYRLESIVIADVSAAIDLNDMQIQALIQQIKLMTKSNKVKLVVNKDTNLIGGFVIKIGSKIIDTSLSGKLNKISLYLNTN